MPRKIVKPIQLLRLEMYVSQLENAATTLRTVVANMKASGVDAIDVAYQDSIKIAAKGANVFASAAQEALTTKILDDL